MHHLCDFFTLDDERELTYRDYPQLPLVDVTEDATYLFVRKCMVRLCTSPSWKVVDTASNLDVFFEQYGVPLLAAYANLGLSHEEDRQVALTSVALAIISSSYQEGMNIETFWQRAWTSTSKMCHARGYNGGEKGFIATQILSFQPNMSEYNRFPGRIHVGGALLGGGGDYETVDGTKATVDWTPFLVTQFATNVKWDSDRQSWYISNQREVERQVTNIVSADDGQGGKEIQFESKSEMQEDSREWCEVYFCNPPLGIGTKFVCGIVLTPVGCKYASKAWFFTHHNAPSFPKPANNVVFT